MNRTLIVIRIEYFVFSQLHYSYVKNPNQIEDFAQTIRQISHLATILKTENDFITVEEWDEYNHTIVEDFVNDCNKLEYE